MSMMANCLGCSEEIDYAEGACPDCGWDPDEWSDRGRHNLQKEGHGEPDSDGGISRGGGPGEILTF